MKITGCMSDLMQGQRGRVTALMSENNIRRRLQDIGLIKGTTVERLHTSPLGDPVAFLIRGAVIALRSEDMSAVLVESEI